uniref:Uncharacterized protein n=1 Tax=Anguilla anguilla TaxID=7936 RepID=A0A0E9XKM7_ANGAN
MPVCFSALITLTCGQAYDGPYV